MVGRIQWNGIVECWKDGQGPQPWNNGMMEYWNTGKRQSQKNRNNGNNGMVGSSGRMDDGEMR
ncbi:MAG: hypothetical protein CVU64_00795 [Deltaproteobacteria bacterium HGW-Deltaproteobacteria-21]|nr:MAG: hypothetical protein CVU64_00795 [Deltaproteobacteria bacterium HGW-Deltaproteobacteria-21]